MKQSFFSNPVWRRYTGRPIWVVSLSDPEHRLRDALGLDGLVEHPRRLVAGGRCTGRSLWEDNCPISDWPQIPPDAGVIVLGRLLLFPGLLKETDKWWPALGYKFKSNHPSDPDYRTICGPDNRPWDSQPFRGTKGKRSSPLSADRPWNRLFGLDGWSSR